MAIRNTQVASSRSLDGDMTADEFKQWLCRFDVDRDGRISRDELRCAMRTIGTRFSGYKSKRCIEYADADGDGYIKDNEVEGLIDYAQRSLGLRIVTY